MNKPIRTVSIFCLVLFLALALNATYLQYYHASALNDRIDNGRVAAATFSRDRGAILAGRQVIAESIETKDQYKFQRVYKQPFMYAPVTGWYTFGNETGVERAQNSFLSGEDDRLFVNRLVDLVNGNATKGGNVVLTINPAAQKAAFNGLKALGPGIQGAVVAIEPATGRILAMVSLPTFDPNKLASHDFKAANAYATSLSKLPSDPLLNRAVQTTLAPGSTFKTVTASAAMQTGRYTATSLVPGGPSYRLPQSTKVVHNEIPNCGTTKIPFTQAMEWSCNTSFAPIAVDVGATGMHKTAEGFGFNQKYLDEDQYPTQAISLYPSGHGRGPDRPVRLRPGLGHRDPAADGDGRRRDRQPRGRDAALPHRRAAVAVAGAVGPRALRGAQPGDLGHQRRRGDQADGGDRAGRHGQGRRDPRRGRRRQDRHRRERPDQPRRQRGPAVRLVRELRAGVLGRRWRSR